MPILAIFIVALMGREKQYIFSLDYREVCLTEDKEIRDHIYQFYKDLFGISKSLSVKIALDHWQDKDRISAADNNSLVQDFTEEEVWDIVKNLSGNKALSPHGF